MSYSSGISGRFNVKTISSISLLAIFALIAISVMNSGEDMDNQQGSSNTLVLGKSLLSRRLFSIFSEGTLNEDESSFYADTTSDCHEYEFKINELRTKESLYCKYGEPNNSSLMTFRNNFVFRQAVKIMHANNLTHDRFLGEELQSYKLSDHLMYVPVKCKTPFFLSQP